MHKTIIQIFTKGIIDIMLQQKVMEKIVNAFQIKISSKGEAGEETEAGAEEEEEDKHPEVEDRGKEE